MLREGRHNFVLVTKCQIVPQFLSSLKDHQEAIACEILKTLFNVILKPEDAPDDADEVLYLKLVPVLASALNARVSDEEKLMELRNNVANLLTR